MPQRLPFLPPPIPPPPPPPPPPPMATSTHQEHRPPPLPPTPHPDLPTDKRTKDRRRAREVSSRYMISLPSPSPSNNPHSLPTPPPRKNHQQPLPLPNPTRRSPSVERRPPPSPDNYAFGDENRAHPPRIPSTVPRRRAIHPDAADSDSDTSAFGDENCPNPPRRRAMSRLFKDEQQQPDALKPLEGRKARPLTPMLQYPDRVPHNTPSVAPRSNLWGRRASTQAGWLVKEAPFSGSSNAEPVTPGRANTSVVEDDVSIENSSENSSFEEFEGLDTCNIGSRGGWCESPPIRAQGTRARLSTECRSSMPEADRIMGDAGTYRTPSVCNRSLNSALSSCQPTAYAQMKGSLKSSTALKLQQCLGQNQKAVNDVKKGKKAVANRQEDVHTLRMLTNQYLQWRFVNARAMAAEESRKVAAERSLHALALKLPELHDSVASKRMELQKLRIIQSTRNILEAQMPYLDHLSAIEVEYSDSVFGITKALQDACLRLPISGDVKVDVLALDEVLGSALCVMDALSSRIGSFLPQAEGVEGAISELSTIVSAERTLVEQCGTLLAEVKRLQAAECSLRSHMIQMKPNRIAPYKS